MDIKHLHNWNVTAAQARVLQDDMARRIVLRPLKQPPRLVAGLDCAFSADKKRIGAVIVVLSFPELEPVETAHAIQNVTFPYVPGLLTFREAPACLAAAQKLKYPPDLFLVDGQGIAHPRRIGLAGHLGLFLDTPAIGCAKSRLIGQYDPPPPQKGSYTLLKDKKSEWVAARLAKPNRWATSENPNEETIGAVLRTRDHVKPLFVSPGHLATLEDAVTYTLQCTTKYRLPEPTRQAHQQVTRLKPEI